MEAILKQEPNLKPERSSPWELLSPEAQVIQSLFHIQTKTGEKVPFSLNQAQRGYDQIRSRRDIIAKARQKGFSSLGIAYQVVDCLTKEGTRAVLISHEGFSTQRLLDKAAFYINHLKGPKPQLGRHSRNEFYFPKMESTFYIGTAGAKAFGRGDTITHLHISEYAWWESDALEKVAGLFQAVPLSGTIRIESTGNGRNNDFYYMVQNAERLGYNVFFWAWHQDEEYSLEPPEGSPWTPEGFENYFQDMKLKYNLAEGQLYWYWIKLLEFRLDLRYMQQEYPSCLEECFQSTGGAIFPDVTRVEVKHWDWKLWNNKYRYEFSRNHPDPRCNYVLGADPSGGTGNDEAAIQVLCLETLEQVFELGSAFIDPVSFGTLLEEIAKWFNQAWIVCEGNHHGIATLAVLLKSYPRQKIYKRFLPARAGKVKYGFNTSEATKPELVGAILEGLEAGLTLYGKKTAGEMLSFQEDPRTGRMEAPEDGLVIALGLACIGYFKYKRYSNKDFGVPEDFQRKSPREIARENLKKLGEENLMYMTWDEIFKKRKSDPLLYGVKRMIN